MSAKINVLLLVKRYAGNYPLLNEMAKLDANRFFCVVCYLGGENDGRNALDGIAKTYYLGLNNKDIKPWNAHVLRRLRRVLDDEQIDVVNCHLQRTIAVGVTAARIARRRPVVMATLHGLGSADTFQRKLGNWLLYRHLHAVVGVSEGVVQDILCHNWGMRPDRVVAICNGIDAAPFLPERDKQALREKLFPGLQAKIWFGTAGRLTKVKNQKRLLEAFRRCSEEGLDGTLLICGRGDDETELRGYAASIGLEGKAHFLGFRSDMADILAALDVFVLPSLREGFGLALVEAMCSRLPVIAANVGGIPEIFGDADIGELIDPANVDSLASAMSRLAKLDSTKRISLGERARQRALENFTSEKMIDKYEKIYESAWLNLPATRGKRG